MQHGQKIKKKKSADKDAQVAMGIWKKKIFFFKCG